MNDIQKTCNLKEISKLFNIFFVNKYFFVLLQPLIDLSTLIRKKYDH